MLDLTLKKDLYEIKWVDGTVLKLNPPTQKQYLILQDMVKSKDYETILHSVYDTVNEIMNNNTEKRVIENVSELGLDTCLIVITDYFEYYQKQAADKVVFLQSQQQTIQK